MGEDRQFYLLRLATAASFLLALLNHLLPPKAFSATQLLFDYELGLTRRGLVGEVLNLFTGATTSIAEIYTIAALISLLGAMAFYLFLSRFLGQKVSSYLLLILALNSFAFASFVGNTGYLDAVLLAGTALALSSDARTLAGLGLRLGVVVLGVLIHENMLAYFTVLIGFDLWLGRKGTRFVLPIALSPVLIGFVVVGVLVALSGFSSEQAVSFAEHLQSKAAFALDANATDVAGRGMEANFALMAELRSTTKYWTWALLDGAPLLAMAFWLIWLAWRLLGDGDVLTRVLVIGAILAPVSLNIIAFDVVRFGAASVLVGFFVLALVIRHVPEAAERLQAILGWPLFVVMLVLNANMFTLQISEGAGHTAQFPWVLVNQLKWLVN